VFRRRGDVVVVLLDGLGIIGALLVCGGLGEEVWRTSAFGLALCDVRAPCECVFAEASGALDGDDGDIILLPASFGTRSYA